MPRGINKVIIVGNLGNDPDTRYSGSGTAITTLSVATSEQWTDKQSGERQERTEWHRVKLFGKLAEIAGEYLKKGRQVYIEGSLRTDKYTDKEGVERYSTDIVASEMQMLGSDPNRDGSGQHQGNGGQRGNAPQNDRGNGHGGRQGNGNGGGNGGGQSGNGGGRNYGNGNRNGGGNGYGNSQRNGGGNGNGGGGGYQQNSGGGTNGGFEDDIPFDRAA